MTQGDLPPGGSTSGTVVMRRSQRRRRWRPTAIIAVAALAAVATPVAIIGTWSRSANLDRLPLVATPEVPTQTTATVPSSAPTPAQATSSPATGRAEAPPERASAAQTAGGAAATPAGWVATGSDDFLGTSLSDHWYPYTGRTAGGVGQYLASNLKVADGVLTITGHDGTSGGLSWGPGQLYGRWEFRARADHGNGYGPVVLLWPDAEDWPVGGEINVMEVPRGERTESHVSVHFGAGNNILTTGVGGDFSQWNTYAVEWMPTYIAAFVNGREVFRTTESDAIPPRTMHLAIQQDVGPFGGAGWIPASDATTPSNVRLQIDWIRIYRR